MKGQRQELLPIRIEQVEGKADESGIASLLALHFTQGDAAAYMRRALERKQEREEEARRA